MEELEKLDVFTNCGLSCLWNGKKLNGLVEFGFNNFLKWKRRKNICISSIEVHGVICMSNLALWFCVMYHSYNVPSQLGPYLWHTLDDGTCMCFAINKDHAIPIKICSKEIFFIWRSAKVIYIHCIITPPFPSKVISCGLFISYYYMGTINNSYEMGD